MPRVCAVVGVGTIVAVLLGADGILLAVGVALLFAGVLLLGPVMARPIARVLGAPVQRWRGVTGAMARGNVQRNPKRTARTAAPVLIGVALVTGASVFAASIKVQLRETIGSTFVGDYVINSQQRRLAELQPGRSSTSSTRCPRSARRPVSASCRSPTPTGERAGGATINPQTAGGLLDFDFLAGFVRRADRRRDADQRGRGQAQGALARRRLRRAHRRTSSRPLTVQGIYETADFIPARTYHRDTFAGTSLSNTAGVRLADPRRRRRRRRVPRRGRRRVEAYGIGELQDRDEFIDSRGDLVDQSLAFVYGLLALSIVIAMFGIVLTLLLAVYERRRETGLLRAVGMTRAQVRITVRWESVLTSVYGAVVGVVLGLVLGYVVIAALRDQGLTKYSCRSRRSPRSSSSRSSSAWSPP